MSTTRASLQPLTKSVLNPELLSMIQSSKPDVSGVSDLVYYTPAASIDALPATLESTVMSPQWPPLGAPVDAMSLQAIVTSLLLIDAGQVNSVTGVLTAAKQAGRAVFQQQHAQLIGEGPLDTNGNKTMSARQNAYVSRILESVDSVLDVLVSEVFAPGSPSGSGSGIVGTTAGSGSPDLRASILQQYQGVLASASAAASAPAATSSTSGSGDASGTRGKKPVVKSVDAFFAFTGSVLESLFQSVTKDPDIQAWLFPHAIIQAYLFIGLGPYLMLRYLSTFVPGPWNYGVLRADVSFYDSRYAKMLIFDSIRAAIDRVSRLSQVSAHDQIALKTLSSTMQMSISAHNDREVGGDALKSMYGQVASASVQARERTRDLSETSNVFDKRRSRALTMRQSVFLAERKTKRAYTMLMLWLVAFLVTLALAIVLLITNSLGPFLMLVGTVLAILALLLVVAITRHLVRHDHPN